MANEVRTAVRTDQPCPVVQPFRYNFSQPGTYTVARVAANSTVINARSNIKTGFTGGTTVSLGDGSNPSSILTTGQINPSVIAVTNTPVMVTYLVDTDIIITVGGTTPVAGVLEGYIEVLNDFALVP